jgi:inner membrane protein
MEPITQVLAAVALARCGFKRITPLAVPIMVTAGLAPDVDWVSVFGGARIFLEAHRTATHSLFGIAVMAAVVATAFIPIGQRLGQRVRFGPAFASALAAGVLHLLLDLTGSYGVKLLWPVSARWFAWDLTASLDPWILFLLLGGLFLPALFRMITEEIGAKEKRPAVERGAVMALVLVALFCCARLVLHQRAMALLGAREYGGEAANLAGAFPQSFSPLEWNGVVDTDDTMDEIEVSFAPGAAFDPDAARVNYKADPSAALFAAQRSDAGAAFLRFARFPLASVEPLGDGYRVTLRDLRFDAGPHADRNVIARIVVDANNHVTQQGFLFDAGEASGGQ